MNKIGLRDKLKLDSIRAMICYIFRKTSGVLVQVRGYTPYTRQQILNFRRIPNVKSYFSGIRS